MTRRLILQLALSLGIAANLAGPVLAAPNAAAPLPPAAPAAQIQPVRSEGAPASTLSEAVFERTLEDSLDKSLGAYLGDRPFILQVRVSFSESPVAMPAVAAPQTYVPAADPEDNLPPEPSELAPGLPGMGGTMAEERARERRLRRVPVPPAPIAPPQAAPQQAAPRIDRIRVALVLPSNLPAADEDYVKNLVFQKADLSFARGDTLDISRRDFPHSAGNLAAPAPLPGSPAAPGPVNPGLPPWVWLLVGAVGAGGLAIAFSLLRPKPVAAPMPPVGLSPLPSAPDAPNTRAAEAILASLESMKAAEPMPMRQDLMVMLLERPEAGERHLRKLMSEEGGLEKAAILAKSVGLNVARRLFTGLSPQEWKTIELASLDHKEAGKDDQRSVMEDAFYAMLRFQAETRDDGKSSPFAFLSKLDESQLVYLLEDEGPRVQALVLSQLAPDRAVGLMRLKTPTEQGAIAAAMGELHLLPKSSFLDLASHLADKASRAPSFETPVTNGLGLLVNLLDHSDRSTEQGILSGLSAQNPALLAAVRESYLTFDDLARVPREVLKDALREVEKETLAEALREAPDAVREAIVASLTERARRIVEDTLGMPAAANMEADKIEATRKDLVMRVRQLISAGRFSMREILSGREDA